MFTIADEPTFTHDVEALVPVDGGHEKQTFKATFRVVSPDELEQYNLNETISSAEFLKRVVVKLHDIGDAEGNAMEWSDRVFEQVLKLPYARGALARAYFSAMTKAKSGN